MNGTRKTVGWLWAGLFYVLVLAAGVAMVGGGTVLATYGWGTLQGDVWHLVAGLALLVAGAAMFAGGAVLLFRITSIRAPGRHPDDASASTGEYYGYTDPGSQTHVTFENHRGGDYGGSHGGHGGGHDGGVSGGNWGRLGREPDVFSGRTAL